MGVGLTYKAIKRGVRMSLQDEILAIQRDPQNKVGYFVLSLNFQTIGDIYKAILSYSRLALERQVNGEIASYRLYEGYKQSLSNLFELLTQTRCNMNYKLIDHGIDNCQYIVPNGTAFTEFSQSYLGCGDTFQEAFDDALESLAMSQDKIDVSTLEKQIRDDYTEELAKKSPSANAMAIKAIQDEDHCTEEDAEETLSDTGSDLYYYVELLV